ncbi:hypothetical protein GCM10011409_45290 [Lentibacillus populi]|uniref:Uncharacterized protein n=1 Tax=Lentibacillus populi TaxID=1827502 RepID=A0A9W5X7V5_9BACI|nr:hypothetical protein [Lentibacillus populi]GGB63144.1 hypothetical protein GCM10011409_45290 [Lentibacillus populi]
MAGRTLSKHEKHMQEINRQYQKGLENDITTALNTAFANVNEDLKQRQQENEENSLLDAEGFKNQFVQGIEQHYNDESVKEHNNRTKAKNLREW